MLAIRKCGRIRLLSNAAGLMPPWGKWSFQQQGVELMRVMAHFTVVALLAVMLGACAWQAAPSDHAHVLSDMTDQAASDSAKCQSSGAALGSEAYKQCRALLEDKMSLEKDFLVDRGHAGK